MLPVHREFCRSDRGRPCCLPCGAAPGIFFLLRPLTARMLAYSGDHSHSQQALQQEINERQRAEERLQRSEQEWVQTFQAITDAVAILDPRGGCFA